jgi:uncharacterized membrane protein required for colicin V production
MKNINNLDIVFFLITFFIVILASYRGIIKEFFSFINWVLAFSLSYLLSPFLENFLVNFFESKIVMHLAIRISVFFISFIVFLLLTDSYCKDLSEAINSTYNRLLGFVFGCFKSMLLFGIIFSLYNCFFDYALGQRLVTKNTNRLPNWYVNSYSSTLINYSGDLIDPIVRGFISFFQLKNDLLSIDYKIKFDQDIQNLDQFNNKTNIKKPEKPITNEGYDKNDIQKMQKLIEIIN